jgi:hypothetical protein
MDGNFSNAQKLFDRGGAVSGCVMRREESFMCNLTVLSGNKPFVPE